MSYEILYGRQFIKTGEGRIIPLVLMGESNCTEYRYNSKGVRYERRVRDWEPLFLRGPNMRIDLSPEELLAEAGKYSPDCEVFTVGGVWKLGKDMPSYIKSGIRTAMTLEDMTEANQSIKVYLKGLVVCYKRGVSTNDTEQYERGIISSTEDLDRFLKRATEIIEKKRDEYRCYIRLAFGGDKPIPYKVKNRRIRKPNPEQFWAIKDERGYYLRKLTGGRRSYAKFCYNAEGAKPFATEKAANAYITKMLLNQRFQVKFEAVYVS